MIISRLFSQVRNYAVPSNMPPAEFMQGVDVGWIGDSDAGQLVTVEGAKAVATAFRCINVLSDDFAKMPEQTFVHQGPGIIERMRPDAIRRNTAYLLERKPNRYMTPFKFKKLRMMWLLTHGASYVWMPKIVPGRAREIFVLPSDRTEPVFENGMLWYRTTFSNGETELLPYVEVITLIINSMDGISGSGVIRYARESLGRRMGASQTQSRFYSQGLNPGGIVYVTGELNKEARNKIRETYTEAMSGSENAYRLAVMDAKISKFEQVTMKPQDAQFLQSIEANEVEIANFFGVPLYKLNMGKQAYSSNEQQNLDYLSSTMDPYLVQTEEVDMAGLLTDQEQETTYIRFNRDALLRTDAKTRAETLEKRILSGQLSLNEARQIEDQSAFLGGEIKLIPSNMAVIDQDGSVRMVTGAEGRSVKAEGRKKKEEGGANA